MFCVSIKGHSTELLSSNNGPKALKEWLMIRGQTMVSLTKW